MATNIFKQLRQYFNIAAQPKENPPIVPARKDDKTGKYRPVKMSSDVQEKWDWWLRETHDTSETLKGRMDRYSDLEYMIYNEPIMAMAAELYADEATQADADSQIFQVQASDKKIEKEIKKLLNKWGFVKNNVREIAYNLTLYGDHFNSNTLEGDRGFTEVVPLDVRSVTDRIEFKLSEVNNSRVRKGKYALSTLANKDSRLKILYDLISNGANDDVSSMFRSYLFGFQVLEDMYLPPWNVSHFRLFTSKSEFYPYGRSMFIFSIGPFRQLAATKNMMALARAAKFPKEKFSISVNENMDQTEIWEAVNEAREEYYNLGVNSLEKEEFAVGGSIWVPDGLLNYELIENRMNLDDIADVELLRDDLIMGTRIPKGYLVVDRSSFGTSGQALLQQFKPFGRAVYYVQSAILQGITDLLKMHFLSTGEFDREYTKFELSMNFPVVEESSDRLRMKGDTLRLANDIIDNIQSALGTRDGLPPEVISSIFSQISFLDPDDVEEWIDVSAKAMAGDDEDSGGDDFLMSSQVNRNLSEEAKRKIRSRLNEDIIRESYFQALESNEIVEGVKANRHYMTSFMEVDPSQQAIFDAMRKIRENTRLEENSN